MTDIIGQPGYMFHNLLSIECEDTARQLFEASQASEPEFKMDLINPPEERFYFVISEKTKDGEFIETSRDPTEWAAAIAIAGSWGHHEAENSRPTRQDIESMAAFFERIALQSFVRRAEPQE
jgi:hypothetical protein